LNTLSDLEKRLRSLSHNESAIEAVREFSQELRRSKDRIVVFNATGALVREPISCDETRSLGFTETDDHFQLLQGDIITTEAAFFLGERVCGSPKYAVLTSSCDLVPGRRENAVLLRIKPILETEENCAAKLNVLLQFKRTNAMYLPPLPGDSELVVCNEIDFDGVCQIKSSDLMLANRIASLSLVGWRVFASFARMVIARANERESEMRMAIEDRTEAGEAA
jgi:hypothetical protein